MTHPEPLRPDTQIRYETARLLEQIADIEGTWDEGALREAAALLRVDLELILNERET